MRKGTQGGPRLLILGGSLANVGGVEAFCNRSNEALKDGSWQISYMPTRTAFMNVYRLPAIAKGLAKLVGYRLQQVDCVWLQYVNLPDLVYLVVAKALGFRVLVTPHLGSNWKSQSNRFLRALSRWMLHFADRLALISKSQECEISLPVNVPRSYIRNFLPAGILSCELPVDNSSSEMQLIHSGRLSAGKGTFLFVDVCAQLRAANVPFVARITGEADEETLARLKRMIVTYDLGAQVVLLGRVHESELFRLLRASDVLIHLSKIDSYPLIVLESIACCTFPICMELAGARDMVESYDGYVVARHAPMEGTVAFLSGQSLSEIRSRSRAAASRVRIDYEWISCVRAVEAALAATVGIRVKASEPRASVN